MTRMRKAAFGALLLAVPIGIAFWLYPARTVRDPPHMRPPPALSRVARDAVRGQMHDHGRVMQTLIWDVVLLEYDRAAEGARQIAEAPVVARPLTHDATELNAQLPPQFFVLQDQLRERSRTLAEVARKREPAALSDTFTGVMETCLGCHGAYLREPQ